MKKQINAFITRYLALIITMIFSFGVISMWCFAPYYVKLIAIWAFKNIIPLLTLAISIVGLFFIYKQIKIAVNSLVQNTKNRRGELLSRACQDLESKHIISRLAAIAQLRDLAIEVDSDKTDLFYIDTISDILCAHLRNNYKYTPGEDGLEKSIAERCLRQAIMDTLTKTKNRDNRYIFKSSNINLQFASLYNLDLQDVNLQGANLEYSNLIGSYLTESNLSDAKLGHAYIDNRTKFIKTDLCGADLRSINIERKIDFINVGRIHLYETKLKDAKIYLIDFLKVDVIYSNNPQQSLSYGNNEAVRDCLGTNQDQYFTWKKEKYNSKSEIYYVSRIFQDCEICFSEIEEA